MDVPGYVSVLQAKILATLEVYRWLGYKPSSKRSIATRESLKVSGVNFQISEVVRDQAQMHKNSRREYGIKGT